MSLWSDIGRCVTAATGAPFHIESRTPVGGGCINAAFRITGGANAWFVKTNVPENHSIFAAEAAALAELARAGAVRVPQPLCDASNGDASWHVLEFIELRPHGDARALGHALAAQHRITSARCGWQRDNTIGATPQINPPRGCWRKFERIKFDRNIRIERAGDQR